MERFDPESVDLANLAAVLTSSLGPSVVGEIVGRTALRDEAVRRLGCSQLEGEQIVDTMVGRGFLVRQESEDGQMIWLIRAAQG